MNVCNTTIRWRVTYQLQIKVRGQLLEIQLSAGSLTTMVTALKVFTLLLATCALAVGQPIHLRKTNGTVTQGKSNGSTQWTFHDELRPEQQEAQSGVAGASPVKIGVYYESLCPDSIRFVREQLWNTYEKLAGIIDIELIPFGKASFKPQGSNHWTFRCQHGPSECKGNMMQACAIKHNPDPQKIVPFVYCVMTSDNPPTSGQQCSEKIGLDWNVIARCWDGAEGQGILHDMGVKTQSLIPRMHFIPWITINGVHTDQIQDQALSNLQSLTCRSYQGPPPQNCK